MNFLESEQGITNSYCIFNEVLRGLLLPFIINSHKIYEVGISAIPILQIKEAFLERSGA